jgi:hypothetical protein
MSNLLCLLVFRQELKDLELVILLPMPPKLKITGVYHHPWLTESHLSIFDMHLNYMRTLVNLDSDSGTSQGLRFVGFSNKRPVLRICRSQTTPWAGRCQPEERRAAQRQSFHHPHPPGVKASQSTS